MRKLKRVRRLWVPRFGTIPDRCTWAVLVWIFINLLWLRFVESHVPQWVGAILATCAAVALAVFSPGPKEEVEEEETGQEVETGDAEAGEGE